jgi:hypothetical protein
VSAPLVFATPSASMQAARLLPGWCVENAVAAALAHARRPNRDRKKLYLGNVVASLARSRSPFSGRPAWLVVAVEPAATGSTPKEVEG